MMKKQLKILGEETLYSAKGHFKSCDIRRNLITITIWGCAVLNLSGFFDVPSPVNKILSAIGLFGTIGLLIWNAGEGQEYKVEHKRIGEQYLSLHKEIRELFFRQTVSPEEYRAINQKVRNLDASEKPDISIIARKWAQYAIQKNDETANWFEK